MDFSHCRHARAVDRQGDLECTSPRIVGLGVVSRDFCEPCVFRDHEEESTPQQTRLLTCAYHGEQLSNSDVDGDCRFACGHPNHEYATKTRCATCADYVYPVVSPETPVEVVREIISQPPYEQHDDWARWSNVQEAHRQHATELIRTLPASGDSGSGRGIVVVGGGKYFVSAYVTIRVLRHVGCRLPIELWHLDGEIDDDMLRQLVPYGVTCRNADDVVRQHPYRFLHGNWWKGWQLKAYALRHCSFEEVLLLDADCYPTRNPEYLFDWQPYRDWGAVFWPDPDEVNGLFPEETWEIFGAASQGDQTTESGQLLVHKQLCWREVNLAVHYNSHADFVYRLLWGDKDTFPLAWRRLGRNYARAWPRADFHAVCMLQYDPAGEVIFQHRMIDKFRLPGQDFQSSSQVRQTNTYAPDLAHESFCHQVVHELSDQWSSAD